MVIGIIGASLAGLVAGKKLAQAGHEITIIEKSRNIGGFVSSTWGGDNDDIIFDHGHSFFTAEDPAFKSFVDELKEKGLVTDWAEKFGYYDGTQFHKMNPNRMTQNYMCAEKGMVSVAQYLARWVELKNEGQAGGLTHIGSDRSKKRSWMINLTDISVFECDAVIIAATAPEAYGVLQTAQDETPVRRIIRSIDEITYDPIFTLMAFYEEMEVPDWQGIECEDASITLIVNESSKRETKNGTGLVLRSTPSFAKSKVADSETDFKDVNNLLLERLSKMVDRKWYTPNWNRLHYWKYGKTVNPLDEWFIEMEMDEAPLALIGDYFGESTLESAFLSGNKLADYWISKYESVEYHR